MKLRIQRGIDRYLGILICRLLSLLPDRNPPGPGDPKNILVILLSEMGSLVLAEPMFRRLMTRYPDARISVLVFRKNREMLEILGLVDPQDIHTIDDRSMQDFAFDTLRILLVLRRLKADAVVDCELFARFSSILAYLSGASRRAGFSPYTQEGLYRGSFINRPVLYNPYLHITRQYLNLVEALDSTTVPVAKREVVPDRFIAPRVKLSDHEHETLMARLFAEFPRCQGRKLILVYPGGGILPVRAWPLQHYCELVQKLVADGYMVAIIGLGHDDALARQIIEYCQTPDCINLTGFTRTIRELMVLFFHSELLVTNDGGPGQFAAMTPIPSIIFYGPESPLLYGSHAENAYFFYLSLSCSPCLTAYNHRNTPCDGDNQCLSRIVPEQVYAKAREMLGQESGGRNSGISV